MTTYQKKKTVQDILAPVTDQLNFENPIIGFGFLGVSNHCQSYLIFKTGGKSECKTTSAMSQFAETRFDQTATPIKTIIVHHKVQNSNDPGLWTGI